MNLSRKGRVIQTGKEIFKYRVRIAGRIMYLPLSAKTEPEAIAEAASYKERVQGTTANVADALRALADRIEGKSTSSGGGMDTKQAYSAFLAGHPMKEKTEIYYRMFWNAFERWASSCGYATLGDIDQSRAKAYVAFLDGNDRTSSQTTQKAIMAIRLIWKKATGTVGPWVDLKSARKTPQVRHQPFSEDDLRMLINRADEPLKGLLALMAYTGARLIDACTMKMSSVQWRRGVIEYLPVKTARRGDNPMMSRVGIHPAIEPMLKGRVGELHVLPHWNSEYKVDPTRAVKAVQAHIESCGIETTIEVRGKRQCIYGSHSFRHTVQTMLANADVHSSVIDVILAHKTAGMGGIYTHVSDKRVIDAILHMPNVMNEGNVINMVGA